MITQDLKTPTRMKHNYTSEMELKSLLIREKNKKENKGVKDERLNSEINELIKEYKNNRSETLKNDIIQKSLSVQIDNNSHENFGRIILLMIKKILTKPNFSGYTWQDEFYSDAIYRIFNYLHNFDYDKTSDVTGQKVNAFAYISQIIHNSIVAIIKSKSKDLEEMHKLFEHYADISDENIKGNKDITKVKKDAYERALLFEKELPSKELFLENINLLYSVNFDEYQEPIINVIYSKNINLTFDDYNNIKEYLKQFKNKSINLLKEKRKYNKKDEDL